MNNINEEANSGSAYLHSQQVDEYTKANSSEIPTNHEKEL